MHREAIDLNLLPVLEALVTEGHVTRAGQRIGLSQPATSNALTRLRLIFDDPILVRVGNTMQPTAFAEALLDRLQPSLNGLAAALGERQPFHPAAASGTVRIATTDHVMMWLGPQLQAICAREAPDVDLEFQQLGTIDAPSLLRKGAVDLIIGVYRRLNAQFERAPLFVDRAVCLYRNGHPMLGKLEPGEPIPLDQYLDCDHLRIVTTPGDPGPVSVELSRLGQQRRVRCEVPNYLSAPFFLVDSDLVATLSERVAERFAELLPLTCRPAPVTVGEQPFDMVWNPRTADADLHNWIRSTMRSMVDQTSMPTDSLGD